MEVKTWRECEDVTIDKFPYRGKQNDVKGISIRWLSKCGDDGNGYPGIRPALFHRQARRRDSDPQPFLSSDHVYPHRRVRVLEL